MKNFPPLIAVLFLFLGCTPEEVRVKPEKRILISGKVLDKDMNPISNIPVATFGVLRETTFRNADLQRRLGYHKTTVSGDFSFTSLDVENGHIAVTANSAFDNLYNVNYATAHFEDGEETRGSKITLGRIILPAKIDFTVTIKNASGTPAQLTYVITYKDDELYYQIMPNGQPHLELLDRDSPTAIGGNHTASEGTTKEVISTLDNSEIIFKYSFGEGESNEIIIPVTSQNNEYVFEY